MKKNFYSLLLILASCLLPEILYGQGASTYSFAESSGTYTAITGTTSSATGDDGVENGLPIGFTFTFGGNPYTTFSVTTNGFLKLGSNIVTGTANYSNAIEAATNAPLIAGFWDDNGMATSSGGSIQYTTQGTPGSQTLTVQWTNCAFATGGSGANVDFQIVLHETTNVVEIIYDGISAAATGVTAAVGITSSSGDYLSVTPGSPSTASPTSANNSVPANTSILTSGTTYTFTPPAGCSGQPAVAQTTASVSGSICAGTAFTLGVTGLPVQSGYTYEFQSSPAGANTWTSLGAAQTSPTFNISSQTVATDYQVIVTCTNSSLSTTATLVSVGQNLFSNCYCTPTSNCTNEGIINVAFDVLNNASTYCASSGYTDYTSLGASATVTQAQIIPISVTARINDVSNNHAGVWIDFDHSGTFEASEYTYLGSSGSITPPDTMVFTANINVPANAMTGVTRMRVRSSNASGITATSACNTSTVYGEYEDYLITINAGTNCSGQPNAGTLSGPSSICSGKDFTLTASGFTNGVLGLTYEWQVYNTATTSWTPAPGTNNGTSYTAVGGVIVPTDYRFVITCTNGGLQNNTATYTATPSVVSTLPFMEDFETSSATLACWKVIDANNDNDKWEFPNSTTYAHSGSYKAELYTDGNAGANDDWLISPAISLTGNQELKYWYRVRSATEPNDYTILLSTTGSNPADFTTVLKPLTSASNTTYQKDSISLSAYTGNVFIAFRVPPGGLDGWRLYFDDVSVEDLPVACSGTPNPVTITGLTSVCSGVNFTLNATGYSFGPGIAWEWQVYDLNTSSWIPAPGTNNTPSYTVTGGITVPTDYRFVTTCANGGQQDITSAFSVSISLPTQCYCTPTYSSGGTNDYIASVQLGTLSNSGTGNTSPYYHDYSSQQPGTIAIPDLAAGLSYNLTLTFGSDGSQYSRVWIDFNQDGIFDAAESFTTGTNAGSSGTAVIPISVPITAIGGNTKMRIRGADDSQPSATQSCGASSSNYGEAEDYLVNILAATPCAGTPDPVTITGLTAACPGTNFTLTATGMSYGLGISYQWEMYDINTSMWVPISGETNTTYTVVGGITTATDYRFVTTCSNGGQQDITAPYSVNVQPFYNCYCVPTSNCTNEGIINVSFNTLNNSSVYCNAGVGYQDFGSLGSLATVNQADVISMSVTARINSNPASVGVWIDYDQNGAFEVSEYTSLGSTTGISPLPDTQVYTANVTIDPNAVTGITRMRVRSANQGGITAASACNTGTVYGEFEDYLITINPGNSCSGQPTAGSITAPASVCSGINFTMTTTGTSTGSLGLTYEWQVYDANTSSWIPAPGTNNGLSYTAVGGITAPTSYRLSVTCANSSITDISSPVSIVMNAPTQCYCIPAGTNTNYYINNFSTNGGTKNISNSGTGHDPGGYGDYTATDTVAAAANTSFTINADFGSGTNTFGVKVWIDFDGDGDFTQPGDQVYVSSSYQNSVSLPIALPATATPIITRMRMGIAYTPSSGPAGPCVSLSGEFEDYTIEILPVPACLPVANLTTANVSIDSADVMWNAVSGAAGYEYVFNQNATPPTGSGTFTTDTTFDASGLTGLTTYYFHVRTDCGSGNFSFWNTISFTTAPACDFCSGAIVIPTTGPYTTVAVSNANATDANDPAVSVQSNSHKGVWFTFIPPSTGSYTISTCQSDAPLSTIGDNVIGIFTSAAGCSGPFTEIASDDDGCTTLGFQGFVTTNLTAATTYYIVVYGYNTNTGNAQVTISGAPLAIKLRDINAVNIGERNRISWATADEKQGDYFDLERSTDGTHFLKIASINANGEASAYTFWDETPVTGVNYYRLKMYDASGNYEYSNRVSATVKGSGIFNIEAYPNPVKESLSVKINGTIAGNATISVTDLAGKVVKSIAADKSMMTINLQDLANGVYLIRYKDDDHSQTLKITKQ